MRNLALVKDHYIRATHRLEAVKLLFSRGAYADTVREAQEVVELLLKALLRYSNIEVPRIHDVSPILLENQEQFPESVQKDIDEFGEISRHLRRDRELAFYGSEDLTPMEFYKKKDAKKALEQAGFVHSKLAFLASAK